MVLNLPPGEVTSFLKDIYFKTRMGLFACLLLLIAQNQQGFLGYPACTLRFFGLSVKLRNLLRVLCIFISIYFKLVSLY